MEGVKKSLYSAKLEVWELRNEIINLEDEVTDEEEFY